MAKSITITLQHELGVEEAHRRIASGLESLRKQFADKIGAASVEWKDNRADVHVSALGQVADATIEVTSNLVTIELRLPLLLAALAEKAQGLIAKSAADALRLPPPH
jgi:Putative polyhydroxyalkanoic acid system protein (PHA_gran_rgn)